MKLDAPRSIDDLMPKARALVERVRDHKGWGDDALLDFLAREVHFWGTSLHNAGGWIKGGVATTWSKDGPVTANQIFTTAEVKLLRKWHSRPWEVMHPEAWERWTRELFELANEESVYPWPVIPQVLESLEVDWPVVWWPSGKPDKVPWKPTTYDRDRMLHEVGSDDDQGRPDIEALVLHVNGRLRLMRRLFGDWYEGRWQGQAPVEAKREEPHQLTMVLA